MPKQHQPNGAPGKKPPAPSIMVRPRRKRCLSTEQRWALELLAGSPHGANEESLVLDHGFSRRLLPRLVSAGLATAQHKVVNTAGQSIPLCRFRITAAGRRVLEGRAKIP